MPPAFNVSDPPPQGDGAGAGPPPERLDNNLIRQLIAAMGASIVNTNESIVNMGQHLTNAMTAGVGGVGGREDQGYRNLKPKKEVTQLTCEGAEELMVELTQFEVDMGELGVSL